MNICLFHKNCRLIPYAECHHQQTVEWLNNPVVFKSFGLTKKVTIESHRQWIKSLNQTLIWAIFDSTNIYCGNILLFINPQHYSAFFQLYIGRDDVRGKGIGYSSLAAVVQYAFDCLKLNRIWLQVFPDNIYAIKLYKKIGFVQEGIEKQSNYFEGHFRDQLRFSLLKEDWKKNKGELL
ncbi:GNAT family N-acetyltransferase [Bacillus sp. S3]|uniref:GNAT family N-acetyltransferase n=1 Tax=Bacillus sp. S3 TaxID=486398 RepID=UPI00118C207F|nr:GNAT family protein [Bacillus sp. S3]QCJ40990.1 GNAT family N-acetyltransferase [Bacillus sp. S3]